MLAVLLFLQKEFLFMDNNFHSENSKNCNVCHVTQKDMNNSPPPLWTNNLVEQYYLPYSSSTLDATIGQPSSISKMCLSCHDGTIASDDKGGQGEFSHKTISSDMGRNHPISFTYDFALSQKDGKLNDPETTTSGLGNTISIDLLVDGKVECTSCHTPHKTSSTSGMLKISNSRSKLCLTCHVK